MRAPKGSKSSPGREAATEALMPVALQGSTNRVRNPELEAAFGARVRAARIAAQMSQTELGDAVGVSFQQVQKYERGQDRVAASTLQGMAAALGVHPGSFYGEDMPVLPSAVSDVKAIVRLGQRIQRVRDPVVMNRLLALADVLAGREDETPTTATDEPS